jgi:lactoylglutathione lyase
MFVHTSIRTSDMNRSIEFYTKLLGLKLINRRKIPQNKAEIAFLIDLKEKGSILELTYYQNQKKFVQADYENRVFDHLAFKVNNMKKTIENMRKTKITITDEPFKLGPNSNVIAFIEDPDGILIELIEHK